LNRDASKRLGSSKGTMFVVGGITELKLADFFSGLDWRLLELKGNFPLNLSNLLFAASINMRAACLLQ